MRTLPRGAAPAKASHSLHNAIHKRIQDVLLDPTPEVSGHDDFPEADRYQVKAGNHDQQLVAGSCAHEGIRWKAPQHPVGVDPPAQAGSWTGGHLRVRGTRPGCLHQRSPVRRRCHRGFDSPPGLRQPYGTSRLLWRRFSLGPPDAHRPPD